MANNAKMDAKYIAAEFSEAGFIEAAQVFKNHSVTDKEIALSFGSTGPNWRVTFIAVRNQCEMWPEY